MEETDAQLQLKKRARRRLVGAIAFVTLVAVVLPMIMDHEPRQAAQDVDIRIPGQDDKPFAPRFATAPAAKPAEKAAEPVVETPRPAPPAEAKPAPEAKARSGVEPTAKLVEMPADKPAEKPASKPAEKPSDKPAAKAEKAAEKPSPKPDKAPEKVAEKAADKKPAVEAEAKRAAAILGGTNEAPAAKGSEHVILIGAFANEANVKQLKSKLGEQGIKVYTEPLDTPQGKKTRVRAGPFASREAADKALEKMKRIGVSGVVTAKQ